MSMDIDIKIDESYLKKLVLQELQNKLGEIDLTTDDIKIEVKSKQNYRAEWEQCAFRARLVKFVRELE